MKKIAKILTIIFLILTIICSVFISTFFNIKNCNNAYADTQIQVDTQYSWVDKGYFASYSGSITESNVKLSSNYLINSNDYDQINSSYLTISGASNYRRIKFTNADTIDNSTKYYDFLFRISSGTQYREVAFYNRNDIQSSWQYHRFIVDSGNNSSYNTDYRVYYTFTSLSKDDNFSSTITQSNIDDVLYYLGRYSEESPYYTVNWNLTNCHGTPNKLYTTQSIHYLNIYPYSGYNYPATISYTGTALDVQYYNDVGEIVITNPTSNFTITASASLPGYTIRYGAYILPKYETFKNLNDFSEQTNGNFYFLNYELGNQYTINEQDIYYPFLTTQATTYQSYTLTKLGGTLTVLDSNNNGKQLIGYDDLDFDNPTYAYYQLNILIVPNSFVTYNSELRYFFNSCYLIEANYNDIVSTINQQFAYNNYLYSDLENERLNAYSNGYHQGLDIGYQLGYDEGINTNIISDSVTGVISAIFDGLFGTIFAIEIFPGFPLYLFILIPIVFAILGIVLWLVRGK